MVESRSDTQFAVGDAQSIPEDSLRTGTAAVGSVVDDPFQPL